MKYICKCNIPRFSNAKCSRMVEVQIYKTYLNGYNKSEVCKMEDGVKRYCNDGTNYCPNQIICKISDSKVCIEKKDINDILIHKLDKIIDKLHENDYKGELGPG